MPTREQNFKKAIDEAKQGSNVNTALQRQIDLVVRFLTTRKK